MWFENVSLTVDDTHTQTHARMHARTNARTFEQFLHYGLNPAPSTTNNLLL